MTLSQLIGDVFKLAESGDAQRLKDILHTNPALANQENEQGLTLLGYAAHFGHPDVVQVLLDYGAEVNAVSHSKLDFIPSNTALHAAIAGERNIEVIQLLLQHHADTSIFDTNGHTSLHTAAFHEDNAEIIHLLIKYGANVNAKPEGGKTARTVAEERGNHKVAELLRSYEGERN
ncbi:ankyrin repeat domain-containing protein [Cohnella pontilimi]|uniref:Ankyrin repeat domain-containing protein n=1 Tax=Cohnella pontilimi TaxID=2564100 RepID=A0A4U0FE95_9BACL|nr:ankyrin repeat domain-containing protein [Cohnella pontilimi]TJY43108.1 ankyrin repeat domain-containing protein [Cohnella pontilimi]